MTGPTTGTGILLRTFIRRDRLTVLWWTIGVTLLYWSQAAAVRGLYTTQKEFDQAAATMEQNAAFIAMAGPARALNTEGGQVAWQATAFGAILVGLMSMFLLGRHTRAEEETGRDELVRSAAIGRQAPQTAALLVTLLANLVVAAVMALCLIAYGLPVTGSLVIGAALLLTGVTFTGVALLAAQLTQGVRAMYGLVGVVLGVSYALRAVGDIGTGTLSWLSPIGVGQAMHPFSGDRWWPGLLLLAEGAVAIAAAYAVFARRDVGTGVLADRRGPERAGAGLHGSFGLTWRLQRGALLGWVIGIGLFGLAYGSIGDDVKSLIGESSSGMLVQGGGDIVDGFYAAAMILTGLLAAAFGISSALRPRGEEDAGRVEGLLATALPRTRWLAGHVVVTVAGTLVAVVLGGLGMGIGYALVTGDSTTVTDYPLAAAPYVAPALVLTGFARLLYGVSARLASLAWLGLGFCFVVMLFADLLEFPGWVVDISPFSHLALVPVEDFRWAPFLVLLAVAAALSAAGQLAFRRRDVH